MDSRTPMDLGDDANLLSLSFYVLLALSSQLSMFLKLCITNTLLHFLLCQSCRSFRSASFGGLHIPFLGLIKRSYHGWLSMMTSSEDPIFSLASGPSTLCPPLSTCEFEITCGRQHDCWAKRTLRSIFRQGGTVDYWEKIFSKHIKR